MSADEFDKTLLGVWRIPESELRPDRGRDSTGPAYAPAPSAFWRYPAVENDCIGGLLGSTQTALPGSRPTAAGRGLLECRRWESRWPRRPDRSWREDHGQVGIGIIGCGNISAAYLTAARALPDARDRAVADMRTDAAARRAAREFGVPGHARRRAAEADRRSRSSSTSPCRSPTPRSASAVLRAGKHVHSREAARRQHRRGAQGDGPRPTAKGLRVGCAPDTFLGGGHQTGRKLIDDGAIGTPRRRHRLLHVPRPRALAPRPRLLLPARRRPDARHGALLHHRPRQPARPGRERHGLGVTARARRRASSPASR